MVMRNTLDPQAGSTPAVDKMLGTAYEVVRSVAEKMPVITYLEANIDRLVTDVHTSRDASAASAVTSTQEAEASAASAAASHDSQVASSVSADASHASEVASGTSAAAAHASELAAAQSATDLAGAVASASASALTSTSKADQATASATAAHASELNAAAAALAAGTSEGSADTSRAQAGASATSASASAAAALVSQNASAASQAASHASELAAADSATASQAAFTTVANGGAADAGVLNGAEKFSLSRGAGLLGTTLTKIAQWVIQTYQGFTQSGTGAVARTVRAELLNRPVTPEQFGAVGDGVTDDYAAITAALTSGASVVWLNPSKAYRIATGIIVPAQKTLASEGMGPTRTGYGAKIIADLNVSIAVTLGGTSGNNDSACLRGVVVTRAAGTPPAGTIGVQIQNTYGSIVEDVYSISHSIGYNFKNNGNTAGINAWCNRIYTGAINDSHIVVDSWPEVRISQSRFGMGVGDYPCDSFIRIQGGSTVNAANGPNTMFITNCHFNLQGGANVARAFINFANQLPGSISDTGEIHINNVHVETCTAGIVSDSTWTLVKRINISNLNWNTGGTSQFISLDPVTQISEWLISNSLIFGNITLAPAQSIQSLIVSNIKAFAVSITANAGGGSNVTLSNSQFTQGLTLAGAFDYLNVDVQCIQSSTLTNTATIAKGGQVKVNGATNSPRVLAQSAVQASVTGTTAETTLATILIPAGAIGKNGALRITAVWRAGANNANVKSVIYRYGGVTITSSGVTSALTYQDQRVMFNRGAQNSQVTYNGTAGYGAGSSVNVITTSVDSSVAQNLTLSATLANSTDTVFLEAFLVEVINP